MGFLPVPQNFINYYQKIIYILILFAQPLVMDILGTLNMVQAVSQQPIPFDRRLTAPSILSNVTLRSNACQYGSILKKHRLR